jgi:hypothetical protein
MTERFEKWLDDGLRKLDAAVPVDDDIQPSRSRLNRVGSPATRSILPLGSLAIGLVALVIAAFLISRPGVAGPAAGAPSAPAAPSALGSPPPIAVGADGIPTVISGEPVLRDQAIAAHILASTDAGPFLVAGYPTFVQTNCFIPSGLPSSPLTAPCDDGWLLADEPNGTGLVPRPNNHSLLGVYRLVLSSGLPGWPDGSGSPVVLRVHVRDQRASACPAAIKQACDDAIVVDSVVWSPASGTPSPVTSTGVVAQVLTNAPGLSAATAEAMARELMGQDAVLMSAIGGPLENAYVPLGGRNELPMDIPASKLVWVVTFRSDAVICPPPFLASGIAVTQPCSSPRPGITAVILDYQTGAFIRSDGFSPGP